MWLRCWWIWLNFFDISVSFLRRMIWFYAFEYAYVIRIFELNWKQICILNVHFTHYNLNTGLQNLMNKILNVMWFPSFYVDKSIECYIVNSIKREKNNKQTNKYNGTNCTKILWMVKGTRRSSNVKSRLQKKNRDSTVLIWQLLTLWFSVCLVLNGFSIKICRLLLNLHTDNSIHSYTHILVLTYILKQLDKLLHIQYDKCARN